MNIHTPSQRVLVKPTLTPAVRTAAANGKAVDIRGNYDAILVALHVGTHDRTDTNEVLDVKIQESADGSTGWTDISGAAFAQIAAVVPDATGGNIYLLNIQTDKTAGRLRYLRAVGTPGGTTPSTAYSVVIYLFGGNQLPPTQDATAVVV